MIFGEEFQYFTVDSPVDLCRGHGVFFCQLPVGQTEIFPNAFNGADVVGWETQLIVVVRVMLPPYGLPLIFYELMLQ